MAGRAGRQGRVDGVVSGQFNLATSRYLIGIDLGTTHTVVAWADLSAGVRQSRPQLFDIPQLVAAGEVAAKPLLPSFRYHPTDGELADQEMILPWKAQKIPGELERVVIGEWARELGSKVEGRLVSSAKSWLSHPQVDRGAAILPWEGAAGVGRVSPVLASASYLHHVRMAWNHAHPDHPMERQQVVVTVPASFDEVARALTVEAAAMAGLASVLLLEEPQAACYAWYAWHEEQAAELLRDSTLLLVCDVGGGTTDLSLISIDTTGGALQLRRIGVGDHLMLGGDNIDLALAHMAEKRIVAEGSRLSAASLSQLLQQTRMAKELLLSERPPERARVTVLGTGARLVGGARSCSLECAEVRELVLEGFLPLSDFSQRPGRRRSAMVEFGLPYVADPAISRHVAAFLDDHSEVCRKHLRLPADARALPDTVLFNGGVFSSTTIKARVLDLLCRWSGTEVVELANDSPHLAVAQGAVAYLMARQGAYLQIGGGSARSFFLGIEGDPAKPEGICLLPKGTDEGLEIRLEQRRFALRLGQPVQFELFSSALGDDYTLGQLVPFQEGRMSSLPPLLAVLEGSSGGVDEVEVVLAAMLTPVGTLQLECVAVSDSRQRWRVEFQLRRDLVRQRDGISRRIDGLPPQFETAKQKLETVFGRPKKGVDPRLVKRLRRDLERTLGNLDSWEMPLLRSMCDALLEAGKYRRRSPDHERVWFNLAGYGLRPGFGYPLDEWRLQEVWPLFEQGLQYLQESQSWSTWWTFWRRIAGGLDPGQQQRLFAEIEAYIAPDAARSARTSKQLKIRSADDMLRLAASLEQLPVAQKITLGEWLLDRIQRSRGTPTEWWALGRVAARQPFHGSVHNVVPPVTVSEWLAPALKQDWRKNTHAAFAAVMAGRLSGDRIRDLDDALRLSIVDKLRTARAPEGWVEMLSTVKTLDQKSVSQMFGEKLPVGLKLID